MAVGGEDLYPGFSGSRFAVVDDSAVQDDVGSFVELVEDVVEEVVEGLGGLHGS